MGVESEGGCNKRKIMEEPREVAVNKREGRDNAMNLKGNAVIKTSNEGDEGRQVMKHLIIIELLKMTTRVGRKMSKVWILETRVV